MDRGPFIACFDSATTVGCCDGFVGGKPRLWSWNLRDGGPCREHRLLRLSNLLDLYFQQNRVDFAYVEAPLPIAVMVQIGSTDETVQLLRGVVAVIEVCCARACVPIEWWGVQAARKAVTGSATFKKGEAKKEVLRYTKLLGYKPEDDNQADALVGWLYESAKHNPRLAALNTPLFGGQR